MQRLPYTLSLSRVHAKKFLLTRSYTHLSLATSQMQHFVNVVRGEEEPLVTKQDCMQAQTVASAAAQSFATGTVVEL